jgi:hypothetical protein
VVLPTQTGVRAATTVVIALLAMIVAVLSPAECRAAEVNDFQTWWDVTTIYRINDRWRYDGDQGARGIVSNEVWSVVYARPSVTYGPRRWFSAHGGVAFFYTDFETGGYQFEIRPWLGARFLWPRPGGFVFSHYFRLEDRYNYLKATGDWNSSLRGRYQIAVKTPKFGVAGIEDFYTGAGFEFFKDLRSGFFEILANRGRAGLGLGKHFGDAWRVELYYIYQSSGLFVQEGVRIDEHILRLRLFLSIN